MNVTITITVPDAVVPRLQLAIAKAVDPDGALTAGQQARRWIAQSAKALLQQYDQQQLAAQLGSIAQEDIT